MFWCDQIDEGEMVGAFGTSGGKRNVQVLMGKSEGGKPLGRPSRRWKDNIKMVPKKWVWVGRAWTRLIWFRIWTSVGLMKTIMHSVVP
jgi:hypothetical protein